MCNGVCTLQALVHRCKERKVSSVLNTNLQCVAVWPVIPECEFLKLGVADQEEKGRQAVSVCYRVGLRGLAKRLCLAWIPRAVEIPLQSQPPPWITHPPVDSPHSLKNMDPVSHTLMDH